MGRVERIGSTTLRLRRLALYLAFTLLLMPVAGRRSPAAPALGDKLPALLSPLLLRILGLRVRRIGEPTKTRPVLFAANHVSYLDITIFAR